MSNQNNTALGTIMDTSHVTPPAISEDVVQEITYRIRSGANLRGRQGAYIINSTLRTITHNYGSRSESGQANITYIGGTPRAMISSNSRTRALRHLAEELTDIEELTEERDRSVFRHCFEAMTAAAPQSTIDLRLDLAYIAAFVGISQKRLDTEQKDGRYVSALMRDYVSNKEQIVGIYQAVADGTALSADDQAIYENPWLLFKRNEDTIQPVSYYQRQFLAEIVAAGAVKKTAKAKELTPLTEMSFKELKDFVEREYRKKSFAGLGVALCGDTKCDMPETSVTGALSVNHSFSTGELQLTNTLGTANAKTPDWEDHAGAELMFNREQTSGVFFEPNLWDMDQLHLNLPHLTEAQFLKATAESMRAQILATIDGGQRCSSTRSFPDVSINVVTSSVPITFEGAFVQPVPFGTEEGDQVASANRLISHIEDFRSMYGREGYIPIILATPTIRKQVEIPTDWVVCESIDAYLQTTLEIAGEIK
ncbi:hypothetical protein Syn8016DRAFT_0847 [Synechococcus sp. WH 8016]|nr:hypothetical protein Syn8016DRAFT_0847 [Synechococcus sp. WH 8016]